MAAEAASDSDLLHGLLLFGHLTGVLLYVGGLAGYLVVLGRLRVADTDAQLRTMIDGLKWGERSAIVGVVTILGAGLAMAGRQSLFGSAWLICSLVLFVVLAVVGRFTVDTRIARLRAALAADAADPDRLAVAHNPAMLSGARQMALITMTILFLMTVQPAAVGSAVTIGVAAGLAMLVFWLDLRLSSAPLEHKDSHA